MTEITVPCAECKRQMKGRELRTYQNGYVRRLVCHGCFIKLRKEDRTYGVGKPKLTQEVSYSQSELPF